MAETLLQPAQSLADDRRPTAYYDINTAIRVVNPLSPDGQSILLELLRSLFGANTKLGSYTVAQQRSDYTVLLVGLSNPGIRVVIKLAGPSTDMPCRFTQTAWVHRLVKARTSLPVGEVVAADVSYSQWPWRYIVIEYIPGIEWAELRPKLSQQQAERIYTRLAEVAADLHSITFAKFGDLPVTRYASQHIQFRAALEERASKRIKNSRHFDLFAGLLDKKASLFADSPSPCLCHEDLHKHNLIFQQYEQDWRVATILDFDSAWAGCHETDLARLEMWHDMDTIAFRRAYNAINPIQEGYTQRRPIYQLLWCLEYASNSPRHLADTAALCAELGLPAITSFELSL